MIIREHSIEDLRRVYHENAKRVVVTNGCFDLLHLGHIQYLQTARSYGEILWVGVNSDRAVKLLKGETRPKRGERERLEILDALTSVDCVTLVDSSNMADFLALVQPDVYVKGGDYSLETLDPLEREALEGCGAEILFVPLTAGVSTTLLIEEMMNGNHPLAVDYR